MDLAIVVELNIMGDLIEKYNYAKTNLGERLEIFERLELKYSFERANKLLN